MTRVASETSLIHMSIETTIAPGQKHSVDPSLIGVFDDALRQARRSEVASDPQPAEPSRETQATQVQERSSNQTAPEDRSRNETARDDTSPTAVKERDTEPRDGVESDQTEEESKAAVEVAEAAESKEETDPTEEGNREDTPNEALGAEAAVQQPVVGSADSVEASIEADVPIVKDKQGAENSDKPSTKEQASSQTTATAGKLPTDKPVFDEASVVPETQAKTSEESKGKEPDSETKDQAQVTEDTDATKALEEVKQEQEGRKTDVQQLGAETTVTSEESGKAASKGNSKRQGQTSRREKQAVSDQPGNAQSAVAEANRPVSSAATLPTSAPEGRPPTTEPPAPSPELAAAPAPSASTPASPPTAPFESVSAVESRGSTPSSQSDAAASTAKEPGHGVDSAKFVQRVANAFAALGQRSGPVRLKLYPPELGSLRMEITVKHGTMSAKVEAETAAAKTVLLENLPILRERLAEQGIKVDRFDVSLSDHSQGGPSERPDSGDRSFGQTGHNGRPRPDNAALDLGANQPKAETTVTADGRLDILI